MNYFNTFTLWRHELDSIMTQRFSLTTEQMGSDYDELRDMQREGFTPKEAAEHFARKFDLSEIPF